MRATTDSTLDVRALRQRFPALRETAGSDKPAVFLDGAGGTQVPESVILAVSEYLATSNSNSEGQFALSVMTDKLIARARTYGGAFVGGDPNYISFGQNMTTLNFNLVRAVGRTLAAGDEIITTALDHDGNVAPWLLMAKDRGLTVRTVGLTEELTLDMEDLRSKLNNRTKVVAFTLASNAVGTLTPAREIVEFAHSVGALAWADAVAYAPHRRIDVADLGCDVLLCSPYKFFGPHLGMSWIRPGLAETWEPERVRPASQEPPGHRFETGTLPHEALAGFVAAIDYLASLGASGTLALRLDAAYKAISLHETKLTEHLLSGVASARGIRLVGPRTADPELRVGTFGLIVDSGDTADLARRLGDRSVYTWNGNFYALGVVQHLRIDVEAGLLRASVVHYNSEADIDRFLFALTGAMA